jgi:hypothetical protein
MAMHQKRWIEVEFLMPQKYYGIYNTIILKT